MKLFFMQWNTGDWLKDPAVSMCTPATRGIWKDFLDNMHELDQCGELSGTPEQLARLGRCTVEELTHAIDELSHIRPAPDKPTVADVEVRNGIIRIVNRRMRREYLKRRGAAKRMKNMRTATRKCVECSPDVTHGNSIEWEGDSENVTQVLPESSENVTTQYLELELKTPSVPKGTSPPGGGGPSSLMQIGKHVFLKKEELCDLSKRFGREGALEWIGRLNRYAEKIGETKFRRKYESHYAAILSWEERERREMGAGKAEPEVAEAKGETKDDRREKTEAYRRRLEANGQAQARFRETVIDPLREELSEASWEKWIRPLLVVSCTGDTLVLYHEHALWVQDHYAERIRRLVTAKAVKITGEVEK